MFVAVLGTIPFTIISMNDYFWDGSPTLGEGINAVVYISIWLGISVYMGYNRKQYFLRFSLIYFSFLIASCLLGYIQALFVFVPIVGLLAGPFNGLEYFIDTKSNLFLWGTIVTLILIILGFNASRFLNDKKYS